MRKEFRMSKEDLAIVMEACKPVPYIVVGGMEPRTPQDNANAAWEALGQKMGFKWETVQPIPNKSNRYFTAEPL